MPTPDGPIARIGLAPTTRPPKPMYTCTAGRGVYMYTGTLGVYPAPKAPAQAHVPAPSTIPFADHSGPHEYE